MGGKVDSTKIPKDIIDVIYAKEGRTFLGVT